MEYYVSFYDSKCELNSKIEKILCLKYSYFKNSFIVWPINILTLFLIQLFFIWWPSVEIFFNYTKVDNPEDATHFLVFGKEEAQIIKNVKISVGLNSKFKSNYEDRQLLHTFQYKLFIYFYNTASSEFKALEFELETTIKQIKDNLYQGLQEEERNNIINILGNCLIEIKIKNILKMILFEFSDPFYLFQIFSIILWTFFEAYYHYAIIIIISTILSIGIGVYETRYNLNGIKSIAEYNIPIKRKENNHFVEVMSKYLAPGDVIEVPSEGIKLPCDCILISGTVVVNESVLTGESTPIVKNDINEADSSNLDIKMDFEDPSNSKYLLFTGTKVVQKRAVGISNMSENNKCLALVYQTGYNSVKGNLIRSILNPKDQENEFKKESIKYISGMFVVVILTFAIVFNWMKNEDVKDTIILFCDMFTIGVPPALPACLGIGIAMAVQRLKKGKVICIKREKCNIAGQVTHLVFDKTGTLTADTLEEYGVVNNAYSGTKFTFDKFTTTKNKYISIFSNENLLSKDQSYIRDSNKQNKEIVDKILKFNSDFKSTNPELEIKYLKEECFACCHSLTLIQNDQNLSNVVGDPIEEEMFSGTNWSIIPIEKNFDNNQFNIKSLVSPNYAPQIKIGVIKQFNFLSKKQRMSVITKCLNLDNMLYKIYTKGSPEKIKSLCIQESLPPDYDQKLKKYTAKGLRVLSFACKLFKSDNPNNISREEAESGLIFLGFYIVQNKLKKVTKQEINTLKNADLKVFMATGDNILTATFISQECFIVTGKVKVLELQAGSIICNDFEERQTEQIDISDSNKKRKDTEENEDSDDSISDEEEEVLENSNESLSLNSKKFTSNEIDYFQNLLCQKFKENYNEGPLNLVDNCNILENSSSNYIIEYISNLNFNSNVSYAIDGNLFDNLIKIKNNSSTDTFVIETINQLFNTHCKIYARMSPEQKASLVKELQIDDQNIVLMCGDGANDCAALRCANVGLSLSTEEASIAAPFTSQIPNISTVKKLIREGKASLVTSFQIFKFMIMYSVIDLVVIAMLMTVNTYISDDQFLIVDLFLIIPFSILVARTGAYKTLNKEIPTKSLFSLDVLISLIMQILLTSIISIFSVIVLNQQKWFTPDPLRTDVVKPGWENTVYFYFKTLFLISYIQITIMGFAFSVSKPFKKPVYTNILLCIFLFMTIFYNYWLILKPDERSIKYLSVIF